MAGSTPDADVDINPELARRLLSDQHPDLADLPLDHLGSGWDNVLYRLGTQLIIRLPRRELGAELARNEARWLPSLAPRLPVAVPTPVRIGTSTEYYPYPWSVVQWVEGSALGSNTLATADAHRLAEFIAALHHPAPEGFPVNPFRGTPLRNRSESFATNLAAFDHPAKGAIAEIFAAGAEASEWAGPPVWIHGDLHGLNMLVSNGSLASVIDFGDITAGDPATDLIVAWYAVDDADRDAFRDAASTDVRPIDDAMWLRARAWTAHHTVGILTHSSEGEPLRRMATACLTRLLKGSDPF